MLFKQRLHGPLRQAEIEVYEISQTLGFEHLTFGIGKVHKNKQQESFRIIGRKKSHFLVHNIDMYKAEVLTLAELLNYAEDVEDFLHIFNISWAPLNTEIELGSYVYPFLHKEMLKEINVNLVAFHDAVAQEFITVQVLDHVGGRIETIECYYFPDFLKKQACANNVDLTDLLANCLNKYLLTE